VPVSCLPWPDHFASHKLGNLFEYSFCIYYMGISLLCCCALMAGCVNGGRRGCGQWSFGGKYGKIMEFLRNYTGIHEVSGKNEKILLS
jgi:hypothetical protein